MLDQEMPIEFCDMKQITGEHGHKRQMFLAAEQDELPLQRILGLFEFRLAILQRLLQFTHRGNLVIFQFAGDVLLLRFQHWQCHAIARFESPCEDPAGHTHRPFELSTGNASPNETRFVVSNSMTWFANLYASLSLTEVLRQRSRPPECSNTDVVIESYLAYSLFDSRLGCSPKTFDLVAIVQSFASEKSARTLDEVPFLRGCCITCKAYLGVRLVVPDALPQIPGPGEIL